MMSTVGSSDADIIKCTKWKFNGASPNLAFSQQDRIEIIVDSTVEDFGASSLPQISLKEREVGIGEALLAIQYVV